MSRPTAAAVAFVAMAVLAGACSSGGDDTASAPETTVAEVSGAGSTGCAAAAAAEPDAERRVLVHDGVDREYDLSIPPGYDGTTPAPVIVDLHGFSSNAEQQSALSDLPAQAGARGYVVVTPQALEVDVPLTTGTIAATFWNIDPAAVLPGFEPADDLGFIDGVLDELSGELCIDPTSFYATGMSNGAGMTMALICGEDSRLAAAAPVAGANLVGTCEPGQSTPVLAFHGDADPLILYEGGPAVGQDYVVEPAEDRMAALADSAGCDQDPVLSTPFDDIESRTWPGCPDGLEFELTTVVDGGHTWPGSALAFDSDVEVPAGQSDFIEGFDFSSVAGHQTDNIEATSMILDFFDSHSGAVG
jgi:polyhydroxybutyrate depolymerase